MHLLAELFIECGTSLDSHLPPTSRKLEGGGRLLWDVSYLGPSQHDYHKDPHISLQEPCQSFCPDVKLPEIGMSQAWLLTQLT